MYRFTKNYFKPMQSPVYEKRRTAGRELEQLANDDRKFWQKILFG